ncbi:hypothetical protein Tco_1242337 [Tanacetum coccineum]
MEVGLAAGWCYDDDDGSGGATVVVVAAWSGEAVGGVSGVKNASEGEWGSGLGRSEEEEHIWCSPEKSTGKLFRWPEVVAGGG